MLHCYGPFFVYAVGLQKKRALLPGQGAPTLSQLLQEAKNRPETSGEEHTSDTQTPLNYSRLFDEYHGVVHLEALELLSKECDAKVVIDVDTSCNEFDIFL